MSIACRSSSRGEKIYILGVSKVLIKAIVIITKAKLHLHAKHLNNVERAIQIHDKDSCFTKLFKLHLLYVNFIYLFRIFLIFSFRNPRGGLKKVVNREDIYH